MRILTATVWFAMISLCCFAQDTENTIKSPTKTATVEASEKQASKSVKLEPNGESHPPSIWMQQKLKHSQKVFSAMVEGDLFQVEDSARHLQLINRLERFARSKSKEYRTQLRLFQYANDEILKGAKEKNLDRVMLGYNQMTISCVKCHKQLRNTD